MNKGKKNVYLCKACGCGFVSIDTDDGDTPFLAKCLNCGQLAISCLYAIPQGFLADHKPAIEWYRPNHAELVNMSGAVQEAVEGGQLCARRYVGEG